MSRSHTGPTCKSVPPATVLSTLQDAGLAARCPAVDHLRNIMASPTAGIDPQALIDTRPLVAALDDAIAQHEALAGLPAKFSVGFDGGEGVSVRDRRNDLWFVATSDRPGAGGDHSVHFRLFLHCGQGRELDTGMRLRPEDCVSLVANIAQAYLAHIEGLNGPVTGKKPRLGHVFAQQGMAWLHEHAVLKQVGMLERARYIKCATMPDQQIVAIDQVDPAQVPYFSLIVIPSQWQVAGERSQPGGCLDNG